MKFMANISIYLWLMIVNGFMIRKGLDIDPAGNKDIVVLVVFSIAPQSACRATSWMIFPCQIRKGNNAKVKCS